MGLWFPEQQELNAIDNRLQAEDPRLGALFGIFTRLTRQEDMPRSERLGVAGRQTARSSRGIAGWWRKRRTAGWSRAAVVAPFAAIVAALSALFLIFAPNEAGGRCGSAAGSNQSVRAIAPLGHCVVRNPVPVRGTLRP
jgi:hypothetical protein